MTLPGGFTARRERDELVLARPKPQGLSPPLPPVVLRIQGETRFAGYRIEASVLDAAELTTGQIKGDKSPFCEYLDLDRVRLPVTVRPRRAGDKFRPLGLDGETKLGKFLTAAKAPRELRDHILVFADQDRIVWVCPIRIGQPVKVTGETRRVLKIEVLLNGGNE